EEVRAEEELPTPDLESEAEFFEETSEVTAEPSAPEQNDISFEEKMTELFPDEPKEELPSEIKPEEAIVSPPAEPAGAEEPDFIFDSEVAAAAEEEAVPGEEIVSPMAKQAEDPDYIFDTEEESVPEEKSISTEVDREGPEEPFSLEFGVEDEDSPAADVFFEEKSEQVEPSPFDVETAPVEADLETRTMADLYEQQGHFKEALKIYEKLQQQDPSDQQLLLKLQQLRQKLQEIDQVQFVESPVVDVEAVLEQKIDPVFSPEKQQKLLITLENWLETIENVRAKRNLL
ncbi:tetratricopeptide repeat protein, partial [candidate division CSSED10-310 bacterium]